MCCYYSQKVYNMCRFNYFSQSLLSLTVSNGISSTSFSYKMDSILKFFVFIQVLSHGTFIPHRILFLTFIRSTNIYYIRLFIGALNGMKYYFNSNRLKIDEFVNTIVNIINTIPYKYQSSTYFFLIKNYFVTLEENWHIPRLPPSSTLKKHTRRH
jgi:hypothetical protein